MKTETLNRLKLQQRAFKNQNSKTQLENIELFLSREEKIKEVDLMNILKNNKILCNTFKLNSVIFSKKENKYKTENGFKLTIFSIKENDFIKLWLNFIEDLNICCIWVDCGKFHNCITQNNFYKRVCLKHKLKPFGCSEYDF